MKKQFLFPHKCKYVGFGILIVGVSMFFFYDFLEKFLTFDMSNNFYFKWLDSLGDSTEFYYSQNFSYTLQILLIVIGGLLVMFSKEKIEDEFTMSIRLKALMLSILVNYVVLLIADILLYGSGFWYVMAYGFYAILIFYVLIFHFLLIKNNLKGKNDAK